jgi:hypothetical protein
VVVHPSKDPDDEPKSPTAAALSGQEVDIHDLPGRLCAKAIESWVKPGTIVVMAFTNPDRKAKHRQSGAATVLRYTLLSWWATEIPFQPV